MSLAEAPPTLGLTSAEAAQRLFADGPNELGDGEPRVWWRQLAAVFTEPMLFLLVTAGVINFLLAEPLDGALLMASVLVVIGVSVVQERRTERALAALRNLSAPRALVQRDGVPVRIPGRDVVVGDVLLLGEGDRVAADAVLFDSSVMTVDESMLTGESVPVTKAVAAASRQLERPGGDGLSSVFAGTLVVRGRGKALVMATAKNTEFGRIGEALGSITTERTALQQEVGRLVRVIATVGVLAAASVIVIYGLTRGGWLTASLAGIAVAMSMLPEEFPVVLTVFLALGAWRMSKRKVLARRSAVVEALGAATVICVDKTGTLTINKMTIDEVIVDGVIQRIGDGQLGSSSNEVIRVGALASAVEPHDPMDRAFRSLAAEWGVLEGAFTLLHEYPLSSSLFAVGQVWSAGDDRLLVAAKGAPEAVIGLCRLSEDDRERSLMQAHQSADRGQRVLAVALGSWERGADLPDSLERIPMRLLGFVGLVDPPREGAAGAVTMCSQAGIRTVMITGDHPGTALVIAQRVGIDVSHGVVTGNEIDAMTDDELFEKVVRTNVFARTKPEQKLRLVRALQRRGEVVAMTGDGVNDAPALRAADIGIAMGQRGTDVAREAASLVITDDNFVSIADGVRLGRGIFDNLRKAMSYVIAVHVSIFGMALFPLFNQEWPLVLLPLQLALLELVIDPACSIVFESEDHDPRLMNQPPRKKGEPLFGRGRLVIAVLQGVVVFVTVVAVYGWAVWSGKPEGEVRSLTFATLVLANLGLIMVNRSWRLSILGTFRERDNPAIKWILGVTLSILSVLIFVPPLRSAFDFGAVQARDVAIPLVAAVASILWFEGYKVIRWRTISGRQ